MLHLFKTDDRPATMSDEVSALRRVKKALLVEVETRGAACLSRFSMELEGSTIELLRQAAEQLVEQGLIRRVEGLGETFERV